jgi:hypothetical protein
MRKRERIEKRENIVEVMKSVGWYRKRTRERFQLRCQVP